MYEPKSFSPPPVIKWTKDWDQMPLDGKRLESFNKRLRILSVSMDDGGEYTCTASNKMGYVERTISVSVKGQARSHKTRSVSFHRDISCF